jgi:hypothetical protein
MPDAISELNTKRETLIEQGHRNAALVFYFHHLAAGQRPVPSNIAARGTNPTAYARALIKLSEAGYKPAARSLAILRRENRQPRVKAKTISHNIECTPADLHRLKRWKMARAGELALELLLFLWYGSHHPRSFHGLRLFFQNLKPFDSESASSWWKRLLVEKILELSQL